MRYLVLFFLFISVSAPAQISGCTDPLGLNYNASATVNDGSCLYANASLAPSSSAVLPEVLKETSGLVLWNGQLLTHNDDTDTNLYSLSGESGTVSAKYSLTGQVNVDWEEISQDDDYFYVGDFGNNASGNRTDLKILRIPKATVMQQPVVDVISFTYQNQTTLNAVSANTTEFDCEAFIVTSDHIYLFTKQWTTQETTVYKLPKTPGSHVAMPTATWNVQGLITGATFYPQKKIVVLLGYSATLKPFVFLLFDFNGDNFFAGNKRKISIPMQFHQMEGITTSDGFQYFVSNERFKTAFINVPPRIHSFDFTQFLQAYFNRHL